MEFKNDAETMNAVIDGLGALVFALVRELPPENRASFATTLARLAKNAEHEGNTASETLLIDLHRAAVSAA
jgi:hypothetical protein